MYSAVLKDLARHLRDHDWQAVGDDHRKLRELVLSTPDDPRPSVPGPDTVTSMPDMRAAGLVANIEENADSDDPGVRVRLIVSALMCLGVAGT